MLSVKLLMLSVTFFIDTKALKSSVCLTFLKYFQSVQSYFQRSADTGD